MRPLAEVASRVGRRLYLLGGDTGVADKAAELLRAEFPALEIAGCSSPMLPAEPGPDAVLPLVEVLRESRAEVVLVALGSPKQEWLIQKLRAALPSCWFVGVGMSFSFLVGHMARAPRWMQKSGLEWVHRLLHEPRRLGTRYLIHGAPFGLELLGRALLRRLAGPRTPAP
jgi:N-acetylglucosaminyldiphosphoundecaprenol N-acetyl-beta-D-mannosaminyltransferase